MANITDGSGGTIELNPLANETDTVQGVCIGNCTLEDGSKLVFDASASKKFKENIMNKCLAGTKKKFCTRNSPTFNEK